MHSVVETPDYLRDAEAIFTVAEREAIVTMVASDPECGEVMQGTGGVRKVRVGRGSRGKSGGGRVVYVYWNAKCTHLSAGGVCEEREIQLDEGGAKHAGRFVKTLFRSSGGTT